MCTPTECRYLSQGSHLLLALAANGTIRSVDARQPRVLGRDGTALVGKPLSQIVAADQHPHLSRLLERTQSTAAVWDQVTFLDAAARPVPLLCCFQRLAGPDMPRGSILLTALQAAAIEADLRAEAATVLGQLAFRCHGPAHRLMQAIEAILSQYPWDIAAQRSREELEELLDALSQSAEWPQAVPDGRPINVVRVLENALRLMDGDPQFKHLKVTLRPDVAAAWADIHPVGMALVTLHLAANARDATASVESPELLIDVNLDRGRLIIEYHDNGSGLDPDDVATLFAPFVSKGERGDHDGVGLATCQELVRFMGGKIRMRSRPAEGTTVVLTFPAAAAPE